MRFYKGNTYLEAFNHLLEIGPDTFTLPMSLSFQFFELSETNLFNNILLPHHDAKDDGAISVEAQLIPQDDTIVATTSRNSFDLFADNGFGVDDGAVRITHIGSTAVTPGDTVELLGISVLYTGAGNIEITADDLVVGNTVSGTFSYGVTDESNDFAAATVNFDFTQNVFELANILPGSGINEDWGFVLNGDDTSANSGHAVASAGDVNNDGIDDILIGAPSGRGDLGFGDESYLVFGAEDLDISGLDLHSLDGTNGFVIYNDNRTNGSGAAISGGGDVNGDGISDILIGAPYDQDNSGVKTGVTYVVFGSSSTYIDGFELSDLLASNGGDGSQGFVISGLNFEDTSGGAVSIAGDINGDGVDDIVIGASTADPNGNQSGQSYVVFGSHQGFSASFDLLSLNGTNGFVIDGVGVAHRNGISISGAGDINGDGYDDFITGAYSSNGDAAVIFGRDASLSPFSANFDLLSLDGSNGFLVSGGAGESSVSAAGDVNGDGYDDFIIGASFTSSEVTSFVGAAFVIFGDEGGYDGALNLVDLDGSNGFSIYGMDRLDVTGGAVSGLGDVNGDGYDDIIIGANQGDPNGSESGESYVIFGSRSGHNGEFGLLSLDGRNGFTINGILDGDRSGYSVSSAGDLNNDGFNDIAIGAPFADPNGINNAGQTYIIYGSANLGAPAEPTFLEKLEQIVRDAFRADDRWDNPTMSEIRDIHYNRNILNAETGTGQVPDIDYADILAGGYVKLTDKASSFHQLDAPSETLNANNVKWISVDGTEEYVFREGRNGWVQVTDDVNLGTFNFAPPEEASGHLALDVFTWILFGNTQADDGSDSPTGSYTARLGEYLEAFGDGPGTGIIDAIYNGLTFGIDALDAIRVFFLGGSEIKFGRDLLDIDIVGGGNEDNDLYAPNDSGSFYFISNGGSDNIFSGRNADIIEAGDGIDTVVYTRSYYWEENQTTGELERTDRYAGVTVNLSTGQGYDGYATGDSYFDIENVTGSHGADILIGNSENNRLAGVDGVDILFGEAGNDILIGGKGADELHGGIGIDTVSYQGSEFGVVVDLVVGGLFGDAEGDSYSGIENIIGSDYNDQIQGDEFANVIMGQDGGDELYGRNGNDILYAGDDETPSESSADFLYGGEGDDDLHTDGGEDYLEGGDGNDDYFVQFVDADNSRIVISETADDTNLDRLYLDVSYRSENIVLSYIGDDLIITVRNKVLDYEVSSFDIVISNGAILASIEALIFQSGDANINLVASLAAHQNGQGTSVSDYFIISEGGQTISGEEGFDTVDFSNFLSSPTEADVESNANSVTHAGTPEGGLEIIYSGTGTALVSSLDADDIILLDIEGVIGSSQSDLIVGDDLDNRIDASEGNDEVYGGDGADVFLESALSGDDVYDGGSGVDTIDYSDVLSDVFIDLSPDVNMAVGDEIGSDQLLNIEAILLGAGNDGVIGNNSDNYFSAGAGDDFLEGEGGADILLGGDGEDSLSGGAGDDVLDGGAGLFDSVDYYHSDALMGITINLERGIGIDGFGDTDSLSNIEVIFGTSFDDIIIGDDENNELDGDEGDDILTGNGGSDILFGGDGYDIAVYLLWSFTDYIIEDEGFGEFTIAALSGNEGIDTLSDVEVLRINGFDYELSAIVHDFTDSSDMYVGTEVREIINALAGNDEIITNAGEDVIFGGEGNDRLNGGADNDRLFGESGADTLVGGLGGDELDGGDGFDTADYRSASVGIALNVITGGTAGEANGDTFSGIERYYLSDYIDIVTGSDANEFFYGEDGNDTINAGGGIDRVYGGNGNDIQRGDAGNDQLYGSAGADQLNGGTGFDIANYRDAASAITMNLATGGTGGDAAGDTYFGLEAIYGSDFNDSMTGNNSSNELRGFDGDDVLDGAGGGDRLFGGEGADTLIGGSGIDIAMFTVAAAGVTLDLATGGTGGEAAGDSYNSIEWVFGSDFDDDITGDSGANRLTGEDGNDTLNGAGGNDRLLGGDGNDTINGGDGVDTIFGQAGDDIMNGGAGNDFFFGDAGADSHDGGTGTDTVSYLASSTGVTVNMQTGGTGGDAAGDTYTNIERIFGSGQDDSLTGSDGNDTLIGNGGNDFLTGGLGNDSLNGGAGLDSFAYNTDQDGADVIQGFTTNEVIDILFTNPAFDSFAELLAVATDAGANTIFNFGGGNTLTIVGQNIADLSDSNFTFTSSTMAEPLPEMDFNSEGLTGQDSFISDMAIFELDALI